MYDKCVSCGAPCPEGSQLCWACAHGFTPKTGCTGDSCPIQTGKTEGKMNTKYIDMADVDLSKVAHDWNGATTLEDVEAYLDSLPPADVAPVVHGGWIDDSGEGDCAMCSECGECFDTTDAEVEWQKAFELFKEYYHFCPCCGAKMDEGGTDDV